MKDTMKVIQVSSPATVAGLQLSEVPKPDQPGTGEVLVRIHANSLNYHDYAVAAGFTKPKAGLIPLSDGAGVVEAVGAGVDEFKVGDHVVSCFFPGSTDALISGFATVPGDGTDGFAREWIVRPANWFTRSPDGYSHAEAATLPTAGLTAWRALVINGGLKPGDTVLVMGTGGVSIFALQLAKQMGATVIATSSSDEKLERLQALGADHVVNYKTHSDWGAKVFALADGKGVDHVVEIGGQGSLPQSLAATRIGGHIALIGVLAGMKGEVPMHLVLGKQIRLQGLVVGSRRDQQDFVRAINAMKLRPVIDRSFPLEQIADAFNYQISGAHFGKICLEF
ncbi:MAG: Alcohol dehydrogenase zinc-binding domain protein [Verrucomicrobiaceae bacterium]|nr:Alcohol dehydrogenase zinc-binding domain protein [Verrucomicrobiaceae bacterium]